MQFHIEELMAETIIRAEGISKLFPGVLANDGIDFDLKVGEIHTILGENGAGKSTFMNILDGLYRPDEGVIYLNGQAVELTSPSISAQNGIGMIHQHFMLVENLSVLENVMLGPRPVAHPRKRSEIERRIGEISDRYGFGIQPDTKVWQLSVGEQQRVEIIKTLFRGARILILDEPTAVLTPQEVETAFEIFRQMVSEGKSIIFISHKLKEVMEISDRITVFRKGKVVGTVSKSETTREDLAVMMVGRKLATKLERGPLKRADEVLVLRDVEAIGEKGLKALNKINLSVFGGEIFGIAGVDGNGQDALSRVITGLSRVVGGSITLDHEDVTNASARKIARFGASHVPPDRLKVGLVPDLSVVENAILRCYAREPVSRGAFIDYKKAREHADRLIDRFDISVPRKDAPVRFLSGGNMQKLILAREIEEEPKLIVAVHPTRGLDVGATEFVRSELLRERDAGVAVLLISEDLDEIFMLSDRIGVIFEGRIVEVVEIQDAEIQHVGLLMAGSQEKSAV